MMNSEIDILFICTKR